MSTPETLADPTASSFKVHLLDVGPTKYGDAVLCQFGKTSVLIDGAHPGNYKDYGPEHPALQSQIASILKQSEDQVHVDLLIISHAHSDHIGCLSYLVNNDILTAKWALVADPKLGWGRTPDEDGVSLADAQTPSRKLAAALREERHSSDEDPSVLASFIDAASTLEPDYIAMVEKLDSTGGTTVVRYGRDDDKLSELLEAFHSIGIKILGPDTDQLLRCAKHLRGRSKETDAMLADAGDLSERDVLARYLSLVGGGSSDAPFMDSQGSFINLMSIIVSFQYLGKKLLFTGDNQLADPEVTDKKIVKSSKALEAKIREEGPYSFVKLAHHGSRNGTSPDLLEDSGARVFGICCGSLADHSHPDPKVLSYFADKTNCQWARTDRNGLSTFTFTGSGTKPKLVVERGEPNNTEINGTDLLPLSGGGVKSAEVTVPIATAPGAQVRPAPATEERPRLTQIEDGGFIEVNARIPVSVPRVTITIQADQPVESGGETSGGRNRPFEISGSDSIKLASGRSLPELLFVTSREALSLNIGKDQAAAVLQAVRAGGHVLIDSLPAKMKSYQEAVGVVREQINHNPNIRGVVLLGGYDVIPSRRLDCLPPTLREEVGSNNDYDDFIVWSDDVYGDRDGDGFAELPVSRIPDGQSPELVKAAIQAKGTFTGVARSGVRNIARPFADSIYRSLPGSNPMLISHPTVHNQQPSYSLEGDHVYLMLHGSAMDGSQFWGEKTPNGRAALGIANIPNHCGPVVFTGCCWGALVVETIACEAVDGIDLTPRLPGKSIALRCLLKGATAYLGCTGSHYSPPDDETPCFGRPMHEAFWKRYLGGSPPALALWEAKRDYADGIPHGQTDAEPQAIEHKIWHQYTCLGLGW